MVGLVGEFGDLEGIHLGSSDDDIAGAHDLVNGDGINDFLIGAGRYTGGNESGRVYLIYGRESGWESDVNLTAVNTTFIGEDHNSFPTLGVLHGDCDNEGLCDSLISDIVNT